MQNKKKIIPEIYNFLRPKQTKNLKRFGVKKDGGYVLEITALSRVSHLVSFGMADEADSIESAVESVLSEGYRTADISADGGDVVGTTQMGDVIAGQI